MSTLSNNELGQRGQKSDFSLESFEFVETNHSKTTIIEEEVNSDQKAGILATAARFSSAVIKDVTLCSGASGSRSFHVITDYPQTDFILRAAIKNSSPAAVSALQKLFQFLRSEGLIVPSYLPALNGSYVQRMPPSVQPWVAFEYIQSEGYVSGTEQQQRQIGHVIGSLHRAFKVFEKRPEAENLSSLLVSNSAHIPPYPALTREQFAETITFAEICLSDFAATEIRNHQGQVFRAIELVRAATSLAATQPHKQLIHRDLHPYNSLIVSPQIGIIDFDDVAFGSVFSDLGYALHTFVRQGAHHYGADKVAQFVDAFLDGYAESNPSVPLQRDQIILQALNESLGRMNRVLRSYSENAPPIADVIARKHMRAAQEVLFIAHQLKLLE